MKFIYKIISEIFLILSPIIILYRILKKKENPKRFLEKFSFSQKKRLDGKLIWFHCSSVGELLSIIPLIEKFEKEADIKSILISTSTLSSSKIFEKFKFKKTIHQFYPIDQIFFTNNFLSYWKPSLAIFIDSEIWPCMFKNLNRKKIPLILLNARITNKSFKNWSKLKNFAESIFNKITVAYPQNIETKNFLKKLNLKKIKEIGNLKFAENYEENLHNLSNNLKKELKLKKVWVASSTHRKEEIFCAKTHLELKKRVKNLITIIIPRHIHRVAEIVSEIKNLNLKSSCHSSKLKSLKNIDIYIVDTFGETQKFHKNSSSVFLGGSIINRGGQNPLEAARYGAKIFHGPNIDNFKDIYALLKNLNISKKISTPKQLASFIVFKKNKIMGNKIKKTGTKILNKTLRKLDTFIKNEYKKT